MAEPIIPSADAWKRVSAAVRAVEAGGVGFAQAPRDPYYVFPAVVCKVTGPAVGGFYPGKILAWDETSEAFVEVEDCYIKQAS